MAVKEHVCTTKLPEDIYKTVVIHAGIYGRSISKELMVLVREALAARTAEGGELEFAQPKKK